MTETIATIINHYTNALSTPHTTHQIKEGLESFVDFLSTGQWVDEKKYGIAWRKRKMPTEDTDGIAFVTSLKEAGVLIPATKAGATSVRMTAQYVRKWRDLRCLKMNAVEDAHRERLVKNLMGASAVERNNEEKERKGKSKVAIKDEDCPRFFNGRIEDDIWEQAPLRNIQMLTITPREHLDPHIIVPILHEYGAVAQLDDNGIVRAMCAWAKPLVEKLRETGMARSIRTTDTKRREVCDIPPQELEEMIGFYLIFVKGVFQVHQKSIVERIGIEGYESQIILWLLQSIRRYDNSSGVPFGAYIATQGGYFISNLNGLGLDYRTAPLQRVAQKAFKLSGTTQEKAEQLGITKERLQQSIEVSRRIYATNGGALRIDNEDDDNSPMRERLSHTQSSNIENVSKIHTQAVEACLQSSNPNRSIVNIVEFLTKGKQINEYGKEALDIMKQNEELRRSVRMIG